MTPPRFVAEGLVVRPAGSDLAILSGVDLVLSAGEILGIVGESGAGKSTLARVLVRILEPDAGRIVLDDEVLFDAARPKAGPRGAADRALRRRIQIVFQEPGASLDPRMTVEQALAEGPLAHRLVDRQGARDQALRLLAEVGLETHHLDRRPHELSGGQRQRVAIARALSVAPEILVLDEPTSALDLELRDQILTLLDELCRRRGLGLILISHDLAAVERVADRIAVMQSGRIVECATRADLYARPGHPYTKDLLRAATGAVAWIDDDPVKEEKEPS